MEHKTVQTLQIALHLAQHVEQIQLIVTHAPQASYKMELGNVFKIVHLDHTKILLLNNVIHALLIAKHAKAHQQIVHPVEQIFSLLILIKVNAQRLLLQTNALLMRL